MEIREKDILLVRNNVGDSLITFDYEISYFIDKEYGGKFSVTINSFHDDNGPITYPGFSSELNAFRFVETIRDLALESANSEDFIL